MAEAGRDRDLALGKTLGESIQAVGDASKDRDHSVEKRLDDLHEDLRAGNRTREPSYGVAPAARQPAPPAVVAEA